jgi:hypothetical protein
MRRRRDGASAVGRHQLADLLPRLRLKALDEHGQMVAPRVILWRGVGVEGAALALDPLHPQAPDQVARRLGRGRFARAQHFLLVRDEFP